MGKASEVHRSGIFPLNCDKTFLEHHHKCCEWLLDKSNNGVHPQKWGYFVINRVSNDRTQQCGFCCRFRNALCVDDKSALFAVGWECQS